jgi:hypothetical protein
VAVASPDNRLSFRAVKVARSTRDHVLISEGIEAGERVLATALAIITEGMEINPVTPPRAAAVSPSPEPVPVSAKPAGVPQ